MSIGIPVRKSSFQEPANPALPASQQRNQDAAPAGPATAPVGGSEEHYRVKGSRQAGSPPESYVLNRIRRATRMIEREEPRWRELLAHFDGDQFVEINAKDRRLQRPTTREGGRKPRWRPRLVRNRMTKAIIGEVSVLMSRTPAWECDPINADSARTNAAQMAEKGLLSLWTKLKLRNLAFRVGLIAAVTGDGYVWPFFDPSKGRLLTDPMTGQPLKQREGEIDVKVLRQDQVGWHPNASFEDSRYYVVRIAQPVEDVMERADYAGPKKEGDKGGLAADATTAALELQDGDGEMDLVFVYHYLERPSAKFPQGRYFPVANDLIIGDVFTYPLWQHDRPCVHRLPWFERPHRQRSMGIGELVIDVQRSINRIVNQLVAWRNLVLSPQVFAPDGALKTAITDEPGKVFTYRATGGKPEWRDVPEIPTSLFKDLEQAYADMDYLAGGAVSLPAGLESGSGVQAVNEREMNFRAMQVANLARWWSELGESLLILMQQHYTEERLIVVQGRFGAEIIPDFMGEDIQGWGTVRVAEASLEPRTRAAQEAKIMAFADKGWIAPFQAMAALNGGHADAILDSFELDISKCHRNIEALKAMGRMMGQGPPVAGPMDNHQVHVDELTQWMKTVDFEQQPDAVKLAANLLLQQHQLEMAAEQQAQAQAVEAQAGAQGLENAGKPQPPGGSQSSEPSRPGIQNETDALAGVS
jgi:hypothetical protein